MSAVQISTEDGHDRDELHPSKPNIDSVSARLGRRVSLQSWKRKDKDKEKSKERGKSKERAGDKKDKDTVLGDVISKEPVEDEERAPRSRSRPQSPAPIEMNGGTCALISLVHDGD